ncbi:MAG: metallophosphoesterase family protein [Rhodospirillales bacterium]
MSVKSGHETEQECGRAYVVGDLHGCLDRFVDLLSQIRDDLADWTGSSLLIFLGDYVDRGDDSAGLLDLLRRGAAGLDLPPACQVRCLKGNHEDLFLRALRGEDSDALWLANGGDATCRSYGVCVEALGRHGPLQPGLSKALRRAVPASHRAFLEGLETRHQVGDYFFCHAGVRPGVPLAEQEEEDLLWIRGSFLRSAADHGAIVVHGHSPVAEPDLLPNRIGIDTGAVYGGRLTALVLDGLGRGAERRFLQA